MTSARFGSPAAVDHRAQLAQERMDENTRQTGIYVRGLAERAELWSIKAELEQAETAELQREFKALPREQAEHDARRPYLYVRKIDEGDVPAWAWSQARAALALATRAHGLRHAFILQWWSPAESGRLLKRTVRGWFDPDILESHTVNVVHDGYRVDIPRVIGHELHHVVAKKAYAADDLGARGA